MAPTHTVAALPDSGQASDAAKRRALRVCHLAYTFYETDNRVRRYARALAERGDAVDVIALRRPGQVRVSQEDGVRVFRLQRRTKTESRPWTYLVKILRFMLESLGVLAVLHMRRPYDVVHVHNAPDFLVFSALMPKLTGAGVILDIHDVLPELYAAKFQASPGSAAFRGLLLTERLSCWFADRVVVANHIWRDRLARRATSPQKCLTILNYPDLRIFHPRTSALHSSDSPFIILYPGSLSRHQGLNVAIRAFAAASAAMPKAEFHIYGEGQARSELTRLARECGLEGRVKIRDPLPVGEIAAIIASADVGVEPKGASGFSNEALSTKILEFMACGVPVIVSRTAVHAYYFDDSVVRFFDAGDERQLATALCDAFHRPPDEAARRLMESFAAGYDWRQRVGDYYRLLDELATVPSRRRGLANERKMHG